MLIVPEVQVQSIIAPFQNQRILIRMPNWLGDLVMATGLLSHVRANCPNAHIAALCHAGLAPLLDADPRLDQLIRYKRTGRGMPEGLRETLVGGAFDLGILLTNSWSSAWWMWRAGVKCRLGYSMHCRSALLTHPIPLPEQLEKQHQVEVYCHLIGAPAESPRLFLQPEERAAMRQQLTQWRLNRGRLVAISPQAAYGPAKRWPLERFRAVAEALLSDSDTHIVWVGDAAGRAEIDAVSQHLPRSFNAAGLTDLRQLMALLACSRVLLTNDSGPMHVASALQVPVVALFGPTNPAATRPYNGGLVLTKSAYCSPCYRRTCPIDHRCMLQIKVNEVVEAVRHHLVGCDYAA